MVKARRGRFDLPECHDAILSFEKRDHFVRTWLQTLTIDHGEVSANGPGVLFTVLVLVFGCRRLLPPRLFRPLAMLSTLNTTIRLIEGLRLNIIRINPEKPSTR